jgi:flagellar biosynthesis/type III secretory pathway chaperone
MTDTDILEHLRSRREYCRALLELSREQRGLIAGRSYSELLSVIARKQRVLGRLDALKQRRPAIAGEWKSRRDELPAELRTNCETLLQETESLLAELLEEEQFCTGELARFRDETCRQLAELASGHHALRAYGNGTPAATHRFLDVNQ